MPVSENLTDILSRSPSFSGLSDVAAGAGRSVAEAPVSFRSLIGQPGYYYNAASNILVITQDGASLRKIDFRGTTVYVQANNVTLAQSLFDASSASAAGSVSVRGFAGYANLTIDHASFDGLKRDKAYQPILGLGTNTLVSNSRFVDLPSDGISIASGRITGNLISGGGYQTRAHADAIAISGFATNGAIQITDNLIDWRTPADAKVATNQAIRATSDKGPIRDLSISRNVLLGGAYTVSIEDSWGGAGSITGTRITDNLIDAGLYGTLYPAKPADLLYDDNYGLTGPVVGVGTESLGRSVAELVAGHKVLQGGTKNDAIGGTAAGDYLFGGAGRDWLSGGGGDDVIEGGADRDYLTGGAGADTFVFRGFNVGQDYIEDFVHGEDRIHLAELPGAPKSAANWSLIGAERFSGSPWQLRTVEGKGITSIQLDRDGDMRADLQIDFKGSHRFTTADFILVTGEP